MVPYMGNETADAVLDLMGGDVNQELLTVHDTVQRITGRPAASFAQWAKGERQSFRHVTKPWPQSTSHSRETTKTSRGDAAKLSGAIALGGRTRHVEETEPGIGCVHSDW